MLSDIDIILQEFRIHGHHAVSVAILAQYSQARAPSVAALSSQLVWCCLSSSVYTRAAMASPSLVGYAAFDKTKAQTICSAGKVSPQHFGSPFQWIPLADTAEGSIQKVFFSRDMDAEAVTMPKDWYILKVELSPEQLLEAFKNNKIMRTPKGSYPKQIAGWRFYDDIAFSGENQVVHEWYGVILPAMGLEQWADKALTGRYELRLCGTCSECGVGGAVTWSHKSCEYCAGCWNIFMIENQQKKKRATTEPQPSPDEPMM